MKLLSLFPCDEKYNFVILLKNMDNAERNSLASPTAYDQKENPTNMKIKLKTNITSSFLTIFTYKLRWSSLKKIIFLNLFIEQCTVLDFDLLSPVEHSYIIYSCLGGCKKREKKQTWQDTVNSTLFSALKQLRIWFGN